MNYHDKPIGRFEKDDGEGGWMQTSACNGMMYPSGVIFKWRRFRPNSGLKDQHGEWWFEGDEGWFYDGESEPTNFRVVFENATFYAEFFPDARHSLYQVASNSTHNPTGGDYDLKKKEE